MKRLLLFGALLILSAPLIVSCMESTNQLYSDSDILTHNKLLTKSLLSLSSDVVVERDVEDYLFYRLAETRESVKSIDRYDIAKDVYVFVVNLNRGGWYLFSGDFSVGPILAQGDEGELCLDKQLSSHGRNWLSSLAEYITQKRTEATDSGKCGWRISFRGEENPFIPDTSSVSIEYVIDTLVYDYYPGLTITRWDQYPPFNNAMPKQHTTTEPCIAGCTVIAIGQLLYYTHFAFGFPNDTYTSASCSSYFDDNLPYSFCFFGPTTTGWSNMTLDGWGLGYYDTYAPALCALIAQSSGTVYTGDILGPNNEVESYGTTSKSAIPNTLSSFFLTGVSEQPFDLNTICYEIQNDRPVLCTGGFSPTEGHAYLIDGYYYLQLRVVEIIKDELGNVVNTITTFPTEFKWHINTGDNYPSHVFWATYGSYCPYSPSIFIGWSQD